MDIARSHEGSHSVGNPYVLKWVTYFSAVHLLGLVGLVYAVMYATPAILWSAVGYYFLCHFAITVLGHRYFTHNSFKMARPIEYIFATLFSGVAQGSLYWWSGTHRKHHKFEDVAGDPHSPQDGFFHAHCGWLMKKNGLTPPDREFVRHFHEKPERYKVVMWQYKNYYWLMVLMTYVVPTLIGAMFGDALGGFLVIGGARLVIQYHSTWSVNSFGHTVGERLDGFATNFGSIGFFGVKALRFVSLFTIMPVLAVLTVGELWHALHHLAPGHWRLGRRWWEIDPGAYFIWSLSKLGLAWDLVDAPERSFSPTFKPLPKAAE